MDDVEVLRLTIESTIARAARQAQNYETEIANLTTEVIRLRSEVNDLMSRIVEPEAEEVDTRKRTATPKNTKSEPEAE